MITLLTLSILCVVGVALVSVALLLVLTLIGLPLAILFGLLPWFLNLAAVVLLVKGLLDRPFRWENLIPAGAALLCAGLLKWLF